jgi:protein-S-isoprenylcysteine O-methyltransferase Ste14
MGVRYPGRKFHTQSLVFTTIDLGLSAVPALRSYRIKLGGGGPGLETPPERVVTSGPYAYSRNPMYLGHIIFLLGLTLTFESWLAALVTIAVAVWFHTRVIGDEKKLIKVLGRPYENYLANVKRWIPRLF